MSPRGAGSHSRPRRWSSRLLKQGPESPESTPTAIASPSTASSDPSLSVKSSLKVTKRGRGRPKKSLRVSWAETVRVRRISEFDKECVKENVELPLQESLAVAGGRRPNDASSLPNKKKDREPGAGAPDEQPTANNPLVAQSKSLGVQCKTASIQGNFSEEEDEGESFPVTQKEEKWWIAESNIVDPTGKNPNLEDVKGDSKLLPPVPTIAKRGRGHTTVQPRRARKTENPAATQHRKGPGRTKITKRAQKPQNCALPLVVSPDDRSSLDSFEAYKYPVKWYWNMTKLIQHDNLTLKKSVARKAANHLRQVTSNANPSARKEESCWNLDVRGRSADYTLLNKLVKAKYNERKAKDILPRGTTYYDPFEYIPDLKDSYATIVELWNDENLYAKSRSASNLGTPALGTIGNVDWQEPASVENCYVSSGYPGCQLPETPCQSAMGDVADIYRSANIALFDELV